MFKIKESTKAWALVIALSWLIGLGLVCLNSCSTTNGNQSLNSSFTDCLVEKQDGTWVYNFVIVDTVKN